MDLVRPSPLVRQAEALQERLRLLFPPSLGFQHEFVPAKLTATVWEKLVTKTPFIGLGWNVLEQDRKQARWVDGDNKWSVYIVTKNQRAGFGPRYFGDSQAHGLLDFVGAAVAMLHGLTIAGSGTVKVLTAGNAYAEDWNPDHSAMAMIDIQVGTAIKTTDVVTGDGTQPHDWTKTEITWRVDGGTPSTDIITTGTPT